MNFYKCLFNFSEIYIIHIFHTNHGLLQFIENTLHNKAYKNPRSKAIEILYTVVHNFPKNVSEKNVVNIYSMSSRIIKSNTENVVKTKVFELLMLCFKEVDSHVESNDSILACKELLNALRIALNQKHSDTGKYT